MKQLLVHRQAVTNRVANSTMPFILAARAFEAVTAARYNVVNTSSTTPAVGALHIPPSGLTLRMNDVDLDGLTHYAAVATLRPGDIIKIGSAQATLTGAPIFNTGVYALQVDALPVAVDGEYLVSAERV